MKINVLIASFLLMLSLASPKANAQKTPEQSTSNLIKNCQKIQKDKQRLACFDMIARSLRTDNGTTSDSDKTSPEFDKKHITDFGLSDLKKQKYQNSPVKPKDLTFKLINTKRRHNQKYRFYLENGQIWEQTDDARIFVPKNGENTVTIKKKSLGSFMLRVNNKGRSVRVKRLK